MKMNQYKAFGNSGLIVSPLALGTMTFTTQRWGADDEQSFEIFKYYYEAQGNFIDTADIYSGGNSERLIGNFISKMNIRNEMVIATKAGFGTGKHPHSGGNGAKHIHNALDKSLLNLQTSYIDLYWIHMWDMVTPAEEVLETMTNLVRSGKIRYWGISNAPAWYISRIVTLAQTTGKVSPIALQLEYSLVERNIEAEHVRLASSTGLAIQPWSPLAGGFLTGKYKQQDPKNVAGKKGTSLPDGTPSEGTEADRLSGDNPFGDSKFTERNWAVLNTLENIAKETGYQPAQVALNWLCMQQEVASTLIGASKVAQLTSNIEALTIQLTDDHYRALSKVSQPNHPYPGSLYSEQVRRFVFGGNEVAAW